MKFLVIGGIDLSQNKETEIQLQYIEKCKELLAKSSTKRPTFHIQNEGCQMNSIQTESIAAIMEKMGYEMVDTEDADAVVFNSPGKCQSEDLWTSWTFKEHQTGSPGYEDRTVRMYDAGASRSRKDP